MFRQYYAQRFSSLYPPIIKNVGGKTIHYADPRDRQIGTIGVGAILYIQDGVNLYTGWRESLERLNEAHRLP